MYSISVPEAGLEAMDGLLAGVEVCTVEVFLALLTFLLYILKR